MKKLGILFAILLVILLTPATLSADDEWWLTPPPPPNSGNTDGWVFDTYEFEPGVSKVLTYQNQDSGPSWQEVQILQMQIDWTGQSYWQWT